MPTKVEKDEITGTETTGHEWDGIKELNTPLPKWWLWVLYITIAWSVLWWILYPSWPWLTGYLGGVLGSNQRIEVARSLAEAQAAQAHWLERIEAAALDEITRDPELLAFSLAGARSAFVDNCVPCHGPGGAGQPGYPSLADDQWLWGGTLEDIHETILYGIRWDHDLTRLSEMPPFGDMLDAGEIRDVAHYLLSFTRNDHDAEAAARGAEVYEFQCAACHGPEGVGERLFGAPPLNNPIWLFGGELEDIVAQIRRPRHGVMPAWEGRLDPAMIKMLSVYVHALGGGE